MGNFLKSTFPDTSQGLVLQADLFLDSSLVSCISFTWFQIHFFPSPWEFFFFFNWRIFAFTILVSFLIPERSACLSGVFSYPLEVTVLELFHILMSFWCICGEAGNLLVLVLCRLVASPLTWFLIWEQSCLHRGSCILRSSTSVDVNEHSVGHLLAGTAGGLWVRIHEESFWVWHISALNTKLVRT